MTATTLGNVNAVKKVIMNSLTLLFVGSISFFYVSENLFTQSLNYVTQIDAT